MASTCMAFPRLLFFQGKQLTPGLLRTTSPPRASRQGVPLAAARGAQGPELFHGQVSERGRPGNHHQPGDGFDAGHQAQTAKRVDVAVAERGTGNVLICPHPSLSRREGEKSSTHLWLVHWPSPETY